MEASLTDDTRGFIYDHNIFIIQTTRVSFECLHKHQTRVKILNEDNHSKLFFLSINNSTRKVYNFVNHLTLNLVVNSALKTFLVVTVAQAE
jgi:hypothetical protein